MGNRQSAVSSPLPELHNIDEILQKYQELDNEKHNNGTVVVDKQKDNQYLIIDHNYNDIETYEKALAKYQLREREGTQENEESQANENLLQMIKAIGKEFNNMCSTSYRIYIIYEYPVVTLADEIAARRESQQKKYFDEFELWSILQSCANGLSDLKKGIAIHPSNIFILNEGSIKIINDDMVDEDYRWFVKKHVYYSPQKFRSMSNAKNSTNNHVNRETRHSLRKESIFSLGMTVVHAALLQEIDSCYNYHECSFNEAQLQEYIEQLFNERRYSEELVELMAMIVEPNPLKRCSLMEIHGTLERMWKSQNQSEQEVSSLERSASQKDTRLSLPESNIKQNSGSYFKASPKVQETLQSHQFQSFLKPVPSPAYFSPVNFFPPFQNKQNSGVLYTDPQLLEMIRRDLQDISELKKSSVVHSASPYIPYSSYSGSISHSTTGYSHYQPQTQTLGFDNHLPVHETKGKNKSLKQFNAQTTTTIEVPTTIKIQIPDEEGGKKDFLNKNKFKSRSTESHKGRLTFNDGAYYEGHLQDNCMHGKGTLFYKPDYPAYQGEWKNNQFNGFGILHNENPQPMEGYFNFNNFNMIDEQWLRYEGNFVKDMKEGEGKLVLTNGEYFIGHFEKDLIDGEGTFFTAKQERIHGVWREHLLVQILSNQ